MTPGAPCPCGSGKPYSGCCGPFIEDSETPETAEALMRSRYTAYGLGRENYLRSTWHPTTRPQDLDLDEKVKWIGLQIVRTRDGGPRDQEGLVEFIARYKIGGRAHRLREASRFVRTDGHWLYVGADLPPENSTPRSGGRRL